MSKFTRAVAAKLGLKKRKRYNDWQRSYAQEGEDIVLLRFFEDARQRRGYYIDVGAHHPTRFSNTKVFYDMGWRGISIDPRPGFADQFLEARPEDCAIEAGISKQPGELTYYMFDEPALNGFDSELCLDRNQNTPYNLVDQKNVRTERLETLLKEHVPPQQPIDFMTVDVEGLDLEVLQSNDWNQYRPRFVLVEIYGQWIPDILDSPSASYMLEQGYQPCSRTRHTCFFEDSQWYANSRAA